ncbi:helix-turn-helix transcriptional regulator [Halomonas sp. MCCC 1A17488]|uniref:Helix-turn-helix transcriptional regulator n=2 Tax=Halomonadaceae TaxID=28256 RepID=A0ABX7W7H9_9GAMM|nr:MULTISPECIES: XRE family transcriptional regulator [Halomonas]MCE8017781.1 helix-turn-helix transcriptional regulator [Halomonas sp. MCCC 1A17488]MCG3241114.1 helix-turn-helix transcriptional regulator [Halomonas sp. MCCC 1A17488]QPP51694.1 helix-turn-helix transcriptional regulator [Halomonas sp. SS10-MC5]QTP56286.1 helix-turn-helix transcriptional regulator [Halomonas sulfidoxydans]
MSDEAQTEAGSLASRVIELRKRRGLTLEQLAAASGVSRSMLSQIERGKANPTLAVTLRIAQAFGMNIGDLVDQPWTASRIEVVRGNDASQLFRDDRDCRIRTLSPLHMEKNVEFYEIRLAPGARLQSAAHFEGTRELLTVTQGRARVVAGENRCELDPGDSAHYHADLEHIIENGGEEELVSFLVVTYQ